MEGDTWRGFRHKEIIEWVKDNPEACDSITNHCDGCELGFWPCGHDECPVDQMLADLYSFQLSMDKLKLSKL